MQKSFGRKKVIMMFLLPAFIVYTLFVVVSVVWAGYYSLFDWSGVGEKNFLGIQNYIQLFTNDPTFWATVAHTLLYTVICVLIQVFGGLLFAVFLSRVTKFRAGLQTLYYVPVVISSVAICQIFTKLLSVTPPGVINSVLGFLIRIFFTWNGYPMTHFPSLLRHLWRGISILGFIWLYFMPHLSAFRRNWRRLRSWTVPMWCSYTGT